MATNFVVWDNSTNQLGYATTIPASRISGLPHEFYSHTDDLSDVTEHRICCQLNPPALINISGSVELLGGIGVFQFVTGFIKYTIDGASTVTTTVISSCTADGTLYYIGYILPVLADSSLTVEITDGAPLYAGGHAFTKCPFLDDVKPNALLDVDRDGNIKVVHSSQRMIDASRYIPPKGCKHVHLVGEYELKQILSAPMDCIKYVDGEFVKARWIYTFEKRVRDILVWRRDITVDRELTDDEISDIEEALGAKMVRRR